MEYKYKNIFIFDKYKEKFDYIYTYINRHYSGRDYRFLINNDNNDQLTM